MNATAQGLQGRLSEDGRVVRGLCGGQVQGRQQPDGQRHADPRGVPALHGGVPPQELLHLERVPAHAGHPVLTVQRPVPGRVLPAGPVLCDGGPAVLAVRGQLPRRVVPRQQPEVRRGEHGGHGAGRVREVPDARQVPGRGVVPARRPVPRDHLDGCCLRGVHAGCDVPCGLLPDGVRREQHDGLPLPGVHGVPRRGPVPVRVRSHEGRAVRGVQPHVRRAGAAGDLGVRAVRGRRVRGPDVRAAAAVQHVAGVADLLPVLQQRGRLLHAVSGEACMFWVCRARS